MTVLGLNEVVVDCRDPAALARFWASVFDAPMTVRDASWAYVESPATKTRLAFQRVPEPKSVKNRVHLDVDVDDIDAEARRLAALGATVTGPPTIFLFDVATGEKQHKLTLGADSDCYVADIHFHDEGFLSVVTYGTPGAGQLLYVLPEEGKPFFMRKMANLHSLSWHPAGRRLAVVSTNPGSNGNGRPLDKDGNYVGNKSPIHVLRVSG